MKNQNAAWGMLSTIVIEMVITPGIFGGGAYFLSGRIFNQQGKPLQLIATVLFAIFGLGIAIYRITLMSQKGDQNHE